MSAIRTVLCCLCLVAVVQLPVTRAAVIIDSYLRSNSLFRSVAMEDVRETFTDYQKKRNQFIEDEFSRSLGADIELTEKESRLNDHVMKLKTKAIKDGLLDPADFIPARHFFETRHKINESPLFKIIQKMPKGGILHAHDTAICNLDFIVNQLCYWDNLWQTTDAKSGGPRFKFSRKQPVKDDSTAEEWELVKEVRKARGQKAYDADLRKRISLFTKNPNTEALDVDAMWVRFMEIFSTLDGILMYKDAWAAYYREALNDLADDEVNYLELRSLLPKLYDLDGTEYNEEDVVQIYYDVTNEYKAKHPKFMGAKVIYAPLRIAQPPDFQHYLDVVKRLHARFPDFVVGFDLVGQEDPGKPLIDFAEQILTLPPTIKFFFHAGETNWSGQTDVNLIDAVLLGTKRIGHGYALVKHPAVLELIKRQGIAVEVNPISNQVLRLVSDTRNHPASVLFSDDFPVIISSDDPSFWEAKPLSHDFFIAFLGIASSRQDLRFLKRLAMNSIKYSAMTEEEKAANMVKWQTAWDKFVDAQVAKLEHNSV